MLPANVSVDREALAAIFARALHPDPDRRFASCGEFVTALANGEEQAKKILEADGTAGGIDGYLVYQMNCWNRVVQTMATSGKPVLYADFQYGGSGGFLVYTAGFLRAHCVTDARHKIQQAGGVGRLPLGPPAIRQ